MLTFGTNSKPCRPTFIENFTTEEVPNWAVTGASCTCRNNEKKGDIRNFLERRKEGEWSVGGAYTSYLTVSDESGLMIILNHTKWNRNEPLGR